MSLKFHAKKETKSGIVKPDVRMLTKVHGQRFALYQYPRGSLSMMG